MVTAAEVRTGEVGNRASVAATDPYEAVVSAADTAVAAAADDVVPPPAGGGGGLARTGIELLRGLALGLLLVLAGLLAVLVSRRRGSAAASTHPP